MRSDPVVRRGGRHAPARLHRWSVVESGDGVVGVGGGGGRGGSHRRRPRAARRGGRPGRASDRSDGADARRREARDQRVPARGRRSLADDPGAHALQQGRSRRRARATTTRAMRAWSRTSAAGSTPRASTGRTRSRCEDGYDTVEWVAAQPWSNGKVGMTGASALGIAGEPRRGGGAAAPRGGLRRGGAAQPASTKAVHRRRVQGGGHRQLDARPGRGRSEVGATASAWCSTSAGRTPTRVPSRSVASRSTTSAAGTTSSRRQHRELRVPAESGREGARGQPEAAHGRRSAMARIQGDLEYPDAGICAAAKATSCAGSTTGSRASTTASWTSRR